MDDTRPVTRAEIVRALARLVLVLAALFGVYALIPLDGERWWIGLLVCALAVVLTTPIALYRARKVMRSEHPVSDAIEAIVVVAGLLVVSFSTVYVALDQHGGHIEGLETRIDAVYFTMTTVTTVGFGDITPTSQPARVIVVVQMVANVVLISVGIRALVAAARRGRFDLAGSDGTPARHDEPR